ncbi:MAG: 4-alpha-glucanotransferase [Lachnospiraceae bacterium]|nr:4-alpha-glucanotransferase [Lachnospiraceae bacterium]
MKRSSGVLLPISSIPSKYGIGAFSKEAYKFIDQLKEAGQSYWQILPLGPTSYGDSPYQSFSTFAGNPYFIDLEKLIEEGVLTEEECSACDFGDDPEYVDYGKIYQERFRLLRKAYERSEIYKNPAFSGFVQENAFWLKDYALFMAVKNCFGGASWNEWAEDIRLRWGFALDYYREKYYYEIEFYEYLQFKFMEQWTALKSYANRNGISIIGDLPIYVAFDSADAWANPGLFQFGPDNLPTAVAGCPPDAFSETGQLWGNPLYRWDYHRNTGYDWWTKRMAHCYKLYDVVRIDHFRGFDEYFSIPYGAETAMDGHWEKGPGMNLFWALERNLGRREVIAEDLGLMTPSVEQLVRDSGYPNMKVLEFAFEPGKETGYLPHEYDKNCIVYTGTHDNDTIVSWYQELEDDERQFLNEYMDNADTPDEEIHWDMIRLAMMSTANVCIIPLQDYLGLGNEARMNRPSTLGTNWKWRLRNGQITPELLTEIRKLTKRSFRMDRNEE